MQYKLKPIRKDVFSKVTRYSNTYVKIGAPLSATSGDPVTGLTEDDEVYFEKALRMQPGTLSPKSDYWVTFHVSIGEDGLVLNTENPEHEFHVKFLKINKLIANGYADKNADAEFVLSCDDEEAKISNEGRKHKKEAYKIFSTLTPSDMRGILLMLGKPAQDVSDDIVEDQLGSEMEANFEKFVSIAGDEKLKYKVFLTKAVNYGIVRRDGKSNFADFYYKEVFLGKGLKDATDFIIAKANVTVYTGIKKELNDLLNTKD